MPMQAEKPVEERSMTDLLEAPRPAEAPPEIDLDTERFYSLQKMYEAEMEKENPNEMKLDRLEAQLEKVQQEKRQKTA